MMSEFSDVSTVTVANMSSSFYQGPNNTEDLLSTVSSDFNTSLTTAIIEATQVNTKKNCNSEEFVIWFVIAGIVCLIGIFCNSLTQFVFWPKINTNSTSFLLVTLASYDNGLLVLQFMLNGVPALCKLFNIGKVYMGYINPVFIVYGWPMVSVLQLASAWNIVVVTLYRYIAVCRPHQMVVATTVQRARFKIAIISVFSLVYYIPTFCAYYVLKREKGYGLTIKARPFITSEIYFAYNVPIYYFMIYIIPFTLLITLTTLLLRHLAKSKRKREQMNKVKRDEVDITVTLLTVVIVFMITQLANPIRRIVQALSDNLGCGTPYFYIRTVTTFLVVLNSAGNFIIYALCGRQFRRDVLNRMRCLNRVFPLTTQGTMSQTNTNSNI